MNLVKKPQVSNNPDISDRAAVSVFDKFQAEVELELSSWVSQSAKSAENRDKLLNGGANIAAFSLISPETRKKFGIFFSGHEVANLVASKISERLSKGATVIDPACGAADLLIACARNFPEQATYAKTIDYWTSRLAGIDLHESFLKTAKSRLMLLATESCSIPLGEFSAEEYLSKFSLIYPADGLQELDTIKGYDCVVTNPPYGYIDAPADITWAAGKLQVAGLFIDKILSAAPIGQEIVAVLPDVLRSGTRYDRWRKMISEQADILSIDLVGKFDKTTDVDVFVIHLKRVANPTKGWTSLMPTITRPAIINDYFNVHVGAVVPHRHVAAGSPIPYIDCSVTGGKEQVVPTKKLAFTGTKFETPFVAIHRTSSPDDKNRLVTSIVTCDKPVAVENHIIVAQPHDGRIESCQDLVQHLKGQEVRDWLNERIRCRHITVSAVRDIPYIVSNALPGAKINN